MQRYDSEYYEKIFDPVEKSGGISYEAANR